MTSTKKRKMIAQMERIEQRFPKLYDLIGMEKMRKIAPAARLKLWTGMLKIVGVGYVVAMFSNGHMTIISLVLMNAALIWWINKWKCYLSKL